MKEREKEKEIEIDKQRDRERERNKEKDEKEREREITKIYKFFSQKNSRADKKKKDNNRCIHGIAIFSILMNLIMKKTG